jgi:hypothetical protein
LRTILHQGNRRMSADPLLCPFCNALVPFIAGMVVGQKITCPNCDETFVLTRTPESVCLSAPRPSLPTAGKPTSANRRLALLVLAGMLLMAGVGLSFALITTTTRREHDAGITRPSRRPGYSPQLNEQTDLVVAPARLAGLAYLPPDLGIVAGFHVEELLASPVGKELIHAPLTIGEREIRLPELVGWTSLKLDDVDHVVVGMPADDALSGVVVVRTRKPYDEARLRSAVKASRIEDRKDPIYRMDVPHLLLRPALTCPDDRTLLLALAPRAFDALPEKPVSDSSNLSAPLRQLLEERVGPSGPVWVVGYSSDWGKQGLDLLRDRISMDIQDRLKTLRGIALAVSPGAVGVPGRFPVTVRGAIECKSADAARELEETVLRPWMQPGEPEPTAKLVRDGAWLTGQLHTDLGALRHAK